MPVYHFLHHHRLGVPYNDYVTPSEPQRSSLC
nr:MAG TPA: hypothetical protein [Caudoviricetes sp.]